MRPASCVAPGIRIFGLREGHESCCFRVARTLIDFPESLGRDEMGKGKRGADLWLAAMKRVSWLTPTSLLASINIPRKISMDFHGRGLQKSS